MNSPQLQLRAQDHFLHEVGERGLDSSLDYFCAGVNKLLQYSQGLQQPFRGSGCSTVSGQRSEVFLILPNEVALRAP
ncbi:unnamed protein product [Sphenostylis stenocarpa]|uniref:Uncharacterized protein n=1 Tax=Sphenostylis stenocarpa TaxID=92480 RepID=A0AA86W462_9FABA|nr:unnamed protein product [Sphenostylis stenocarpa]